MLTESSDLSCSPHDWSSVSIIATSPSANLQVQNGMSKHNTAAIFHAVKLHCAYDGNPGSAHHDIHNLIYKSVELVVHT